ncbi:MAG: HlyC/CorC family transporter [Alphaproteobacteria bacterium]|nr:HlyC/CorC family transporter [Alphaproteobacteria bacterium]
MKLYLGGLLAFRETNEGSLRDTIEELIEEGPQDEDSLNLQEKALLTNVLGLQDLTADDVMTPRADIVALEVNTPVQEIIKTFIESKHTKLPIYRESLDDVIGFLHITQVLASAGDFKDFNAAKEMGQVLFIAPSMRILDLLMQMRSTRAQMAIVVDEFGGVDGLITISNLIDEIIGGLNAMDGHEVNGGMSRMSDGSFLVNARIDIEAFEQDFGRILTDEERKEEDIETLGGLVVSIAGRVPTRKEIITHSSGVEFEVLDADPRRVKRLRVYGHETRRKEQPAVEK